MIPMNFIVVGPDWGHNPREVLEDPIDGLIQIVNSRKYSYSGPHTIQNKDENLRYY